MSTKINTLKLYVNGKEVYPNLITNKLEETIGYTPDCLLQSATLAQTIIDHPTNHINYNLYVDHYSNDPAWYDYWGYFIDGYSALWSALIFWPKIAQSTLSLLNEPYDLGGPDCVSYPNIIYLGKGIIDLYSPAAGVSYEWHYNWNENDGYKYVMDHYGHDLGLNNNNCDSLSFSGTMEKIWDENLQAYTNHVSSQYRWMFKGCRHLGTIKGLRLTGFDMTHDLYYTSPFDNRDTLEGFEKYFMNCENLWEFEHPQWPTTFTGPCYSFMFYNCQCLQNNQFPTITFAMPGQIYQSDGEQDVLTNLHTNCDYMFYGCKFLNHNPITTASLQYVDHLKAAFAYTAIQTLELPANMSTDSRIMWIIQGCKNLTQLIIRTEGLAGFKEGWYEPIYGQDPNNGLAQNVLFNPSDIDQLNENLAIYVPDSELQDWIDMHSTGDSEHDQTITNMFHGLSDLSE